jgi:ribose transport system permease protein
VATLRQILNGGGINALAALALVIPLTAGVYDLSVSYAMSLAGVTACELIANHGFDIGEALLVVAGVVLVVGIINGVLVVGMGVDSFIGTLATGSVIAALTTMASGGSIVSSRKLSGSFAKIGQAAFHGYSIVVLYVAVIAVVFWFLLQRTRTGRRLYATGFNAEAARLAGVKVGKLRVGALIVSGLVAGLAGITLASTLSSGSPDAGSSFLLPTFASVFLGATQLQPGRFNVGGTLIAVLVVTTGTIGLGLSSAPQWAGDMLTGVILVSALLLTGSETRLIRIPGRLKATKNRQLPDVD